MTSDIEYLREHGPSTREELPTKKITALDRIGGVYRVNPTIKGIVAQRSLVAVYYLKHEHAPRAVAEKWVDANSDVLARSRSDYLHRALREMPGEIAHEARLLLGR